ncbi:PGC-1 and ERR-induced regulator in muscle protein 1 [Bagarius yarrelli]|uniref:PGC-1 and ERR-induced regulator in muscle protein 1 n=1 Tax=Bagarius yarrelli TaxID=175774 RepID=A0A556U607_BAGYA|nr:PGC-1 and ERR-induced regulator in muscle protein 1 [Bagarius yarrelli]
MDDFEYSVQISELDWDTFFQACEECNMLPPGLAGLDDSGMSDMDDMASQQAQYASQNTPFDPEILIDGPPDCEGSPVDRYLSKYGLGSPEQVLSGSEDDFHLEAINVYFERLKNVSVTGDHIDLRMKMAGHSEGSDVQEATKEMAACGETSQLYRNLITQSNDSHTFMFSDSTDDEIHKSTCPDTELIIQEEAWSLNVLKEGDKWDCKMKAQPDPKKSSCNNLVNGKDPNQVNKATTQLVSNNNSDLLVTQVQPFNVTPRRRRKKKKRTSVEITEIDPEFKTYLPGKVSDSDEDTYGRNGEMIRETYMAECSGYKNTILDNFTILEDIRKSIMVSPILQKKLSRSAVGVKSKKEIDRMSDGNLTGKQAESAGPESANISVTERTRIDGNQSTHTKEENAGNLLQFNINSPSEMPIIIASSEVANIEEIPVSTDNPVSHHTSDVKSQTNNTALQLTPLILSHAPVCSKTPRRQLEDRVTLSDFQLDETGAVDQRKTSTSCITFPELTNKTLFSATYKNAEMKEISPSVTFESIHCEHKNNALPAKESMSERFLCKFLPQTDYAPKKHQTDHKTQEIAAQNPKAVEIKDISLAEPEAKIANENVLEKPGISVTFVNSQNEDWTENNSLSLRYNNVQNSQTDINMEAVEILPSAIKVVANEELSFSGQTEKYQPLIHTTDPESKLSVNSRCNLILSKKEQEGSVLNMDTPPCYLSKDPDLSPTIVVQDPPSTSLESTDSAKSLEILDQPTPPVYAISSFWNEMEKLTINDILRLRLVGQSQHPSVLLQPDDSSITDAIDTGYFMHSDEPKPDHSNRNKSFISDFDGELSQLSTPDAAKLVKGKSESPKPTGIIWESDSNLSGTATEMEDMFNLDTGQSSSLFRTNSSHCFRKMCKNVSVQNLQALEGQKLGNIIRNTSFNSIRSVFSTHSDVEDDYVDPFDRVENSSPVYLSDEEEMDSSGVTFSEIFEYLFGTDEPRQSACETNTEADTSLSGTETSVLEMYEHFFSDFEPESLFYPLTEDNTSTDDELVPIFSSSRSATRTAQFPDVYDYFFPDDSPVHSDEDEEPEHTVIRVVTRYDHNPTKNLNSVTASDAHKPFFHETDKSWNFVWTNPFSFRRVWRTGVRVPNEEFSNSQALTLVKNAGRSFHRGIQPINILGADESLFPDPLIFNLENCIFRKLAEQQAICREMQTSTVADPRLDAPLLPIKQADMCLVCIAFASWVLKSVNTQGADTWKAVLLANISALSAIRYLRKFTRDEAAKISPLRQIKPT